MSLSVSNLQVYYRTLQGDVKALDDVSFEVADGEIMGIAGESGCGKTTLGKSLIRLDGRMRLVGGSVELDGAALPIGDDRAMNRFRFREVSIVPQYAMSALNPIRKIGRMISELLDSRGVSYDKTLPELRRRLELVGLDDTVLDLYPIELSGGMKQRTVLVLSTLLDPSLLIADELTSALDVSSQRAVSEMLVEFRDRGYVKTIIVITHDLAILYQIADTILVMYAGKLAEKAPAETIVHSPAAPLHTAAPLLPPRGRGHVRRAAARTGSRDGRPPCSTRRPVAAFAPAARSRTSSAASSRRSSRSMPTTTSRAGRREDEVLTLRGVSKTYKTGTFGAKSLLAVRDVSFDVRPGEVVSLIGESGSGKSTIGRMILRLSTASDGVVSFEGADVSTFGGRELKGYYRHVQGVFQDPFSTYNPIFKADRVFAMIRRSYFPHAGDAEWRTRLERAMEDVRLDPETCLGKYPHQLSGGQLQRLLIARALLLDIKLLVADEIISMLDASTRIDVLNLLGDLRARGLGILFITHDLSLGNYISDRTVILRRGAIVEMGATARVFGNPMHPYTRMLIASVPHLHRKWETRPELASWEDGGKLVEVEPEHLVALEAPA